MGNDDPVGGGASTTNDPAGGTLLASLARGLGADEAEQRRQATAELGRLPVDDGLPLLLHALGDEDWRVRKEATLAARAFGPSRQLMFALVRVLGEVEGVGLRNAAVDVLAAIGAPAVGPVAAAYPELDADGRKLVVDTLGRSGAPAALEALEAALDDVDPNVRAAAIEAIAGLGAVAPDRVAEVLLRKLEAPASPRGGARALLDPVVLVAVLEGLTALGVAAPWPHVAALLEQPTLRAAALSAAALIESPDAARAVADVLIQTGAHGGAVFDRAVRALGRLAEGDLAPGIRDALRGAGPELGRRLVAAALPTPTRPGAAGGDEEVIRRRTMGLRLAALVGAPGVVDAAVTALGEDLLADEAQRALATIGRSGLSAMFGRLADDSVSAEARGVLVDVIVGVLEEVVLEEVALDGEPGRGPPDASEAHRGALSALRGASTDPEWPIAVRALRGLARIGGEEDLAFIAEQTLAPTRVVGAAAEGALGSLAARFPAKARALAQALASDGSRALPAAILIGASAAAELFDEHDTTFLAHAATVGDPRTRRAAVEAVAALRAALGASYATAIEVLGFALTDEEHEVQIAAARALGRLCSASDAPRASDVLDLVDRSGAADLVAAAVRAIGEGATAAGGPMSGAPRSTPSPLAGRVAPVAPSADLVAALALFARGAPSQVALAAVDALANAHRAGAPGSLTALASAVDHPDEAVVKAALLKLAAHRGALDAQPVLAGLTRGIAHASPALRAVAAEALGEQGTDAARAELSRRLPIEPDRQVVEAIRRALPRAGEGGGG